MSYICLHFYLIIKVSKLHIRKILMFNYIQLIRQHRNCQKLAYLSDNILMLLLMIIYGDTPIHHVAQKLSFCPLWPSISYITKCSLFITPNEFVNIQSTFITQNVKKGSADLELASEGITNVTEYCKLLPVALFPKHQQLWYGVLGLSL